MILLDYSCLLNGYNILSKLRILVNNFTSPILLTCHYLPPDTTVLQLKQNGP